MKHLKDSKCHELETQEKFLSSQLQQAHQFINELKSDKSSLLQEKTNLQQKEKSLEVALKGQERKVENLSEQILEIEAEFNKTTIKYHEI